MSGAGPEVGDPAGIAAATALDLIPGILVRRYKRFLADVMLASGAVVTAHCPNPGSMLSVDRPDAEVWLSRSDKPGRKLLYTWELIRVGETLVGINTFRPNGLAAAAIEAGGIPELAGYPRIRREVRYGGNCRIDLLLEAPGRPRCFVEVKSVTMRRDCAAGPLEFPDAVTGRGARHLAALADVARGGDRAVLLFLAQRGDGHGFAIASDIDRAYATAFTAAIAAGVEILCYCCKVSRTAIRVDRPVPLIGNGIPAVPCPSESRVFIAG